MLTVNCRLKGCAYRNTRGYCQREHIVLEPVTEGQNELFCLGWATPETKLFTDVWNGRSDALPEMRQNPESEDG